MTNDINTKFPTSFFPGNRHNASGCPVLALDAHGKLATFGGDDPICPDQSVRLARRAGMVAIATYSSVGSRVKIIAF
jgi:hypothetical protein